MQIGLDSYGVAGKPCVNERGDPTAFTSTAYNLDWIRGVIDGSISGNTFDEQEPPKKPSSSSMTDLWETVMKKVNYKPKSLV